MAVPNKNSKIRYTTYPNSKNNTSKKPFHKPEAYGELIRIQMTLQLKIISVVSIVLDAAFTALAVYAAFSTDTIEALEDSGFSSSMLYLLFPVITWIITVGFRLMCRVLPIDMWRLPAKVKKGIIICEGRPLKLATLLLEIGVTGLFIYITLILMFGRTPAILILVLFIVLLAAFIYFPGRYAYRAYKNAPSETEK